MKLKAKSPLIRQEAICNKGNAYAIAVDWNASLGKNGCKGGLFIILSLPMRVVLVSTL